MTTSATASRLYARALAEARPYWPHLATILAVGLAWLPIALLMPLPVKLVVDGVLGGQPLPGWLAALLPDSAAESRDTLLGVAAAMGVGLAFLSGAHTYLDWLLRDWVAERMVLEFRGRMLLSGLALHPTSHDRGSQEPVQRITNDAPALQWTALYGIIPMIVAGTSLAGVLAVVSMLSTKLAVVALVTSVPLIALIHWNQNRLRDRWHGVREQEAAALSVVHEALGAGRLVTTFGAERREAHRFVEAARRGLKARTGVIRVEGLLGLALGLSTALGTTAILVMGVRDVQAGFLSVGDLLLVIGYVGQLYQPLQQIGTHITGQQRALVSAERAFAVVDTPPAVADRPDARPLGHARGEVSFEGVGFGYDDRQPVLAGVSFAVPAGSRVGIVGRTGSGKTTLVNLLIRQFDPTGGRIRLDGVDMRDWRLADLRRQFAVVSQEPVLFSTTIRDNIAYADPGASFERVVAAA
ncbi:MAG TPA: ABC transporter ATP-binding protein, partial [Azospirillaceae bacterium]|nr:ABC transporter ATP-binding protein [Azospirillaceae bacterium]